MKDLEINGYKIFENEDEAVYAAKSKEDVYNYFVEMYGSTEDCQNQTKDQFIEQLVEHELNSESVQKERTYCDEGNSASYYRDSSYYKEYKKVAEKNNGVDVIAYLVW